MSFEKIARKRNALSGLLDNMDTRVIDSNVFYRGIFITKQYYTMVKEIVDG